MGDIDRLSLVGLPTAQLAAVVGFDREVLVDTDKRSLTVHDGVTPGGFPLLREDGPGDRLSVKALGAPMIRSLEARFGEQANVLDFGAKGDSTADDIGAFQDAAHYLMERGGGVLRLPTAEGHYVLGGTLDIADVPIRIVGVGSDLTSLLVAHSGDAVRYTATGEFIIDSGPGVGRVKRLTMDKLAITGFADHIGAAVRAVFPEAISGDKHFIASDLKIAGNIALTGGLSHGLWLTNANGTVLSNVQVYGSSGEVDPDAIDNWTMRCGIVLDSSYNSPHIVHYWNKVRVSYAHWALDLSGHFEGMYADTVELGPNSNGMRLRKGAANTGVLATQFANFHVDVRGTGVELDNIHGFAVANGLFLRNTGGKLFPGNVLTAQDCNELALTNVWMNCASPDGVVENGILLGGTVLNPQFSNVIIKGAKDSGLAALGDTRGLRFTGHIQDSATPVFLGDATTNADIDARFENCGPAVDDGTGNRIRSGAFTVGNREPVAGSKMQIDHLLEEGARKVADIAGIWPGKTYAHIAASKTFDGTTAGGADMGSPLSTAITYAWNDGCPADVVAGLDVAVAGTSGDTVFGRNIIVSTATGTVGSKIVGLEIDVEPAEGTTVSGGSGGIFLNAFNVAMAAPGIQLGGIGGSFENGILIGGVRKAGLAGQMSASMECLIDTGAATYTDAAMKMSNGHRLRWGGTGAVHGYSYMDGSNNLRQVLGAGGLVIRNNADTSTLVSVSAGGDLKVEAAADLYTTAGHGLVMAGVSGPNARLYNDTANNLRVVPGATGIVAVRNAADTATTVSINATGDITAAGTVTAGSVLGTTAATAAIKTAGYEAVRVAGSAMGNFAKVQSDGAGFWIYVVADNDGAANVGHVIASKGTSPILLRPGSPTATTRMQLDNAVRLFGPVITDVFPEYADEAAAKAGGCAVGQWFRSGTALHQVVTP